MASEQLTFQTLNPKYFFVFPWRRETEQPASGRASGDGRAFGLSWPCTPACSVSKTYLVWQLLAGCQGGHPRLTAVCGHRQCSTVVEGAARTCRENSVLPTSDVNSLESSSMVMFSWLAALRKWLVSLEWFLLLQLSFWQGPCPCRHLFGAGLGGAPSAHRQPSEAQF